MKRIKRSLDTSRVRAGIVPAASSGTVSAPIDAAGASRRRVLIPALVAAAVALIAGLGAGKFLLQRSLVQASLPAYHPLTFRRGMVHAARFAPDGKTIIYSAAWEGKSLQLFTTRPESPESHELEPCRSRRFGGLGVGRNGAFSAQPSGRTVPVLRHAGARSSGRRRAARGNGECRVCRLGSGWKHSRHRAPGPRPAPPGVSSGQTALSGRWLD